jgi:glycosyltransferase involved in cell wall biosynthesis
MRIAFVHFPGRLSRLEDARAGKAPTEFLFGAIELERDGHEVEHYEADPGLQVPRIARVLVDDNAGRGHLPPHLAAAVLRGTHALLPDLRRSDVVVATTTATAMALAVWRRAGRLRRPLVGILAGLFNRPWRHSRRLTTTALLRRMHTVLYGPGELEGLEAIGLDGRVHVVPFGVDTAFWTPRDVAPTGEVFAIGNDGSRDWDTLLAAAARMSAPVRIMTRHARPATLPENVTWEAADWYTQILGDDEVRGLYRSAAVVVVPTKDVTQPSGQSVTLQGMSCGRPVVLSRTRGLFAPETLVDGENILLARSGDADELARSVRALLDDDARARAIGAAARETVVREASVQVYAQRLLEVCRLAVERP